MEPRSDRRRHSGQQSDRRPLPLPHPDGTARHDLDSWIYDVYTQGVAYSESGTLDGIDTSRRVLLQMAQGITITETEGVTSEALLVSTESSYSKAAGYEMTTAEQEDGDPDGPFSASLVLTQ